MNNPPDIDACAIGVDVGGTKTKACLVRLVDGAVLIDRTLPTPCSQGGAAVLDLVVAMTAGIEREAGEFTRGADCPVGVCIPELVTNDGEPASAWNFDWQGLDYKASLSAFGPVLVESDVRSAAFAEGRIGAGRDAGIFVYVTLSTGMAHTLVINGNPYGGARGFAIHFASSDLVAWGGQGRDCEVRQNLETFASGKALGERFAALKAIPSVTARDLVNAAQADHEAKTLLENALLSTASYLGQLVNILDPSILVLGGGMGLDPAINGRLGELARQFIFAESARQLPIVPALLGESACAIGVSMLAHRARSASAD